MFDSAWVGYEQFIPMMKCCSPLLLELGPKDPVIVVTQSVHKQQTGINQTSQIYKKNIIILMDKKDMLHIKDLIMLICYILPLHHFILYLLL